MPLYAHPQASAAAPDTDQAEGPSLDDVAELCEEFGFVPGNNGALLTADVFRAPPLSPLPMLRDMITAAITRWPLPVARPITSDWQPIETAPVDGTEIFAWDGKGVKVAWCYEGRWIYDDEMESPYLTHWHPTHWQPLPGPPNTINHP
jgi:hypothetical protein